MVKNKNIIIAILCVVIAVMAVAYAAFSTSLNINGIANITSTWDVRFTDIEEVSKTSGVTVKSVPVASGTSATFNVDFTTPGDNIIYDITVENNGTLDAIIENIIAAESTTGAIKFEITGIKRGDTLNQKTTKVMRIKIKYDENIKEQPDAVLNNLTVNMVVVQDVGQLISSQDIYIIPTHQNGTVVYFNPDTGLKCDNYIELNSDTGNKSGCMKWYVFNDSQGKDTLDLLLDHNTTATVRWSSTTSNTTNGDAVKAKLATDVSGWNEVVKTTARLISANEIAVVTKNSAFDSTQTGMDTFYFDTNTPTQSETCKYNVDMSKCNYGWLYDRTGLTCQIYGCLNASNIETYGYWTSSASSDYAFNAWSVGYNSKISNVFVDYDDSYGVRPVITVSKSVFQ